MPDIEQIGVSLQEILGRRKAFSFQYYGHTCHVTYHVEKVTGSFSTDLVRMINRGLRLQRSVKQILSQTLSGDDTDEDFDADAELSNIEAASKAMRHELAVLLQPAIAEWDLTDKGMPYAITVEHLEALDVEFVGELVTGILQGGQPLGEANGRRNLKSLPSTSRRKARRAN